MWRWIPIALVALLIVIALSRFLGAKREVQEEARARAEQAAAERARVQQAERAEERFSPRTSSLLPDLPGEGTGRRLARLLGGDAINEAHRLAPVEVMEYVARHKSNAFSLVTAFAASGDQHYLKLAAERFPDDPLVQSRVLLHDLFPEERQKWIEAFKQSAPENSFPHFLGARELLSAGDAAGAVAEINAAREKTFDDFTQQMALAGEEAYLSAGRNPAEAKVLGSAEVLLPHLRQLRDLGNGLAQKASVYAAAGDAPSQQALLAAGWEIGNQLRADEKAPLVTQLVGVALENQALGSWPDGVAAPFINQTPAEHLAENRNFRDQVRNHTGIFDEWLPTASENEIIAYFERAQMFGELEALKWLKNQR